MGMDCHSLTQPGADFHANIWGWGGLLEVAEAYGWEPRGTLPPLDEDGDVTDWDWSGGYWSNDGQRVSEEDAGAIADALEAALDDEGCRCKLVVNHPAIVRRFIDFCRLGEFDIC